MSRLSPPAVPLVTHHPYFSVWSPTAELHREPTMHWTGATHGLVCYVSIDGTRYRLAGRDESAGEELPPMTQTGLDVRPTTTEYTFEDGGVELVLEFTSPLLLDDLDLLSRPASYVTVTGRSTDGDDHDVRVYVDVTGEWCTDSSDQPVDWDRTSISTPNDDTVDALRIGTVEQDVLGRVGDDVRIDWGRLYLVPPTSRDSSDVIGGTDVRSRFRTDGRLPARDEDDAPRPIGENPPVLACTFDLDVKPAARASTFLTVAYDDRAAVEYFGTPIVPYWRREGATPEEMVASALDEYRDVRSRCARFDDDLVRECVERGGTSYAEIASLAYRQAIAAHALVEHDGELLFFSKECFSNGCIATADVTYPSAPLFYRFAPALVKGMLRPIFRFAATDEWPYEFAPHDVGTYPKANGQVYGKDDETGELRLDMQMPIEECGNVLIATAAVSLLADDPSFAAEHWGLLTQWADYLVEHGYDPGEQLCTDDFAGHLAHNANLSLKAIFGIASYGLLCELRDDERGSDYLEIAAEMADRWQRDTDDGAHSRLAFDQPGTWSLKYNLVWDRLFDLELFDDDVRKAEVETYLDEQRTYGVPLDNRETYTKVDWEIWAATLAADRETFEAFVEPIHAFLEETPDRVPFTDWYDTESAEQIQFQHRSVVGGVFLPLLEASDFVGR